MVEIFQWLFVIFFGVPIIILGMIGFYKIFGLFVWLWGNIIDFIFSILFGKKWRFL